MKIKITFTTEENATAAATLDALRRMHPTARAHQRKPLTIPPQTFYNGA